MVQPEIVDTEPTGADNPYGLPTLLTFHKGRVALYAALKALGIGPGDEVIIPGYTCVVVPNAVSFLGAKPVYADIDPSTYNLRPDAVLGSVTTRTRALVIQHTYGIPADVESLCRIAHGLRLPVVEDCAHTMRSKWKACPVGSFGDAAVFSSQWSKPITTGMGGWVRANNLALQQRIVDVRAQFEDCGWGHDVSLATQYFLFRMTRSFRTYWATQRLYHALGAIGIGAAATHAAETRGLRPPHYERRMSPWQERKLREELRRSEALDDHRQRIAALYDRLLRERGIQPFTPTPEMDCVLVRYPVRVPDKPGLLGAAQKRRLEIGDWFISPIHPKQDDWVECGYLPGSCPNAEDAARHVINLPTHDHINPSEAERIVEFIVPYCSA